MNIKIYNIIYEDWLTMLEKEIEIKERLEIFKSKHPDFSYTIEKEELNNVLTIKRLYLAESVN